MFELSVKIRGELTPLDGQIGSVAVPVEERSGKKGGHPGKSDLLIRLYGDHPEIQGPISGTPPFLPGMMIILAIPKETGCKLGSLTYNKSVLWPCRAFMAVMTFPLSLHLPFSLSRPQVN